MSFSKQIFKVVVSISIAFAMIGCGGAGDSGVVESLKSQLLSALKVDLQNASSSGSSKVGAQSTTVQLTAAEIDSIVNSASSAIDGANLAGSNDLNALLPEMVGGALAASDTVSNTTTANQTALVEVLAASAIEEVGAKAAFLSGSATDAGQTASETALSRISSAVIANLDETSLTGSDVPAAVNQVMKSMVERIDSAGIPAAQVDDTIKHMMGSAVGSLDDLGKMTDFDEAKLGSAVKSMVAGATGGISGITMDGFSEANLPDVIHQIGAGATGALGEISMTGYDQADIPELVKQATSGIVSALDDITTTGYDVDDVDTMVNRATAGVVSALDDITMAGYDETDLSAAIQNVSSGAIGALDEISMTNYDVTKLSDIVKEATAGAVSSLDEITMTGYDQADLQTMIGSITAGATGSLDDITMPAYDASDLPKLVGNITAGCTASLDEITMTGYDATDLPALAQHVAFTATGSLDDISMADYDENDLRDMVQEITTGTTSSLDEISMPGYDYTDLSEMAKSITLGATDGIDGITMPNYDSGDINDMMKSISTGATGGIDGIAMTGFDGNYIDDVMTGITQGATDGIKNHIGGGFTVADPQVAIENTAEGIAYGSQQLSDDYTFNNTDISTWISAGVDDYYAAGDLGESDYTFLDSQVTTGASADPIVPCINFMDSDFTSGEVSGLVDICPLGNTTGFTHYVLYWGSDHETKLSGQPAIAEVDITATFHTFATDTAVPTGANHLLIFLKKTDTSETTTGSSVPFQDMSNAGMVVSGGDTGSTGMPVDGTYVEYGMFNGKTAYFNATSGMYIFFEQDHWIIHYFMGIGTTGVPIADQLTMTQYYISSTASTPPTQGWSSSMGTSSALALTSN